MAQTKFDHPAFLQRSSDDDDEPPTALPVARDHPHHFIVVAPHRLPTFFSSPALVAAPSDAAVVSSPSTTTPDSSSPGLAAVPAAAALNSKAFTMDPLAILRKSLSLATSMPGSAPKSLQQHKPHASVAPPPPPAAAAGASSASPPPSMPSSTSTATATAASVPVEAVLPQSSKSGTSVTPAAEGDFDIVYEELTIDDLDDVVNLIGSHFGEAEPMSLVLGLGKRYWTRYTQLIAPHALSTGLVIGAFKVPATGSLSPNGSGNAVDNAASSRKRELVGVSLNEEFAAPLPAEFDDFCDVEFPESAAFMAADQVNDKNFLSLRPDFMYGTVMQVHLLCTSPAMRGRGVANRLIELSVDIARRHGFLSCVVQTTGAYSQAAVARLGFKCVTEVRYADFEFEGTKIFSTVPSPHTTFAFMELML